MNALGNIDDKYVLEATEYLEAAGNQNGKGKGGAANARSILPKMLLVAALFVIPASAMGDSSLYGIVQEKVQGIGATEQQIREACANVAAQHLTPDQVSKLPALERNASGQVYGYGFTLTDLVLTPTDDGKWGYSYTKDLFMPANATPRERLFMMTNTRQLPVYESDGTTIVGYFTCGWHEPYDEWIAKIRSQDTGDDV